MAYAAVVSVEQILSELLNGDGFPVSYPRPEIEALYDKVCSLRLSVDELSYVPIDKRSEVQMLESQIRDVMYRAQDSIELFISRQIWSSAENSASVLLQKLEEISAEIDHITTEVEMVENVINGETSSFLPRPLGKRREIVGAEEYKKIVGLEEDIQRLKDLLEIGILKLRVITITGSAGTGKTTLASCIFDDPWIRYLFDLRSWVQVSQDYNITNILFRLLGSLGVTHRPVSEGIVNELMFNLHQVLYGRRYLIVLDDVWDQSIWDHLRFAFPDNDNGSRIIICSRTEEVIVSPHFHHVMRPLDEESSWILFCQHVFEGLNCPPHLEDVGRRIAEKCGGIPVSIVMVGGLLSQKPKTEEYWASVEEDVHAASAFGADSSYLEIIYLSYHNLPGRLKPCFLYMAAFPEDSEILVSKLINFWVAEGFLTKPSPGGQNLEMVAKEHLKDLVHRNLIKICKWGSDGQPKTCGLQGNLRQVAVQECRKEKFFHTIKMYAQQPSEDTRRISIHNNIIMCSQDVYNRIKSIEAARTLLYAGANHHQPLPLCLTFQLLRVLDAFTVYFVELPNELFELIHLRYLGFTYDEDLPPSISRLRNLLILIVRQHPQIMFRRASILPSEIWNLPRIRNLLVTECFLPEPSNLHNTHLFKNLQSLSNVNTASCTKEILQKMPNLKKLVTWMEEPGAVQFDLFELTYLEVFKFTVLKPIPGHKIDFRPQLFFPQTLKKLSLSGCGLPWEDMEIIAQLPQLEVLKLRELAFQGEKWRPYWTFEKLKFLLLESLDLALWEAEYSHFPELEHLIIRHCYQLEMINPEIGFIGTLVLIELVDCSPTAKESVEVIRIEQEEYGNMRLQVRVCCSWE